jgi:LysM domain-containing protein
VNKAKLTPLGRLLIFVLILTLGAIAGAAGATATRPHAQAWRCITVRPGETLWSLAARSGSDDHRAAVQKIIDENRLQRQSLWAGASIWVPSEGDLHGLLAADASSCPAVRDA